MARPRGTVNRRPPGSPAGSVSPALRSEPKEFNAVPRPAAAHLTYVLDSMEIALEDFPDRRQFDICRAWLVKLVGAARAEDRRRRGVMR